MLTDKMQNCISQNDMLQGVSVLLCALSGGADSIAMTHALLQLCRAEGITLNAVHLNHSLRGEESQRDADFVRDFCE
ncbi:MAG: ATP-binding protein, partial [Oscillospiraceae bacterium]